MENTDSKLQEIPGDRSFQIGSYFNEDDNEYCQSNVTFNSESTIQFYDKHDNIIMHLDPTELSVLYGAYQMMLIENKK